MHLQAVSSIRLRYAIHGMREKCLASCGSSAVETLFSRLITHSYSNRSCATETPPEPNICEQQSMALDLYLTGIQGGNSPHPGKKNPEDSLTRQLISDASVRKGSVKVANEEYVMRLRVAKNATDDEIQSALHQLFSSNNQSFQCPQGNFETAHKDQVPSQISFENKPSVIAPTAVSKLQLDNYFQN